MFLCCCFIVGNYVYGQSPFISAIHLPCGIEGLHTITSIPQGVYSVV